MARKITCLLTRTRHIEIAKSLFRWGHASISDFWLSPQNIDKLARTTANPQEQQAAKKSSISKELWRKRIDAYLPRAQAKLNGWWKSLRLIKPHSMPPLNLTTSKRIKSKLLVKRFDSTAQHISRPVSCIPELTQWYLAAQRNLRWIASFCDFSNRRNAALVVCVVWQYLTYLTSQYINREVMAY